MKLKEIKTITGKIVVKTGLHIGAGNENIEIGGMDNPVIRDPATKLPYIPGSSIKGKMRALLELLLISKEIVKNNGEHCKCGKADCKICRVFGAAVDNKNNNSLYRGPTRLIMRDAYISEKFRNNFEAIIIEEKNENKLNRITAAANPRPIERVVPGVEFDFELSYRVFDTGDGGKTDEELFETVVLAGLTLLQNDYLGGGGSRGNGRIEFIGLKDNENNNITLPNLNWDNK
ncbi:type III-A CRISPR-associated RAMP protein Csm3 [Spirochaetia bacterium 38H-sp]|uniref:CRISPR system Cms endoribonuclease Csm3 n=1 Tax=Rarispira pelagica TaxID=3141764 RepID=A0ABU9U964_9SPIR